LPTRPSSSAAPLGCNSTCLCCWPALQPGHHGPKNTLSHGSPGTPKIGVSPGQADGSAPRPVMAHRCDSRHLPLTAPSSHRAMDRAGARPALPWPRHRPLKPPLLFPSPSGLRRRCHLRGPLRAHRGAGGRVSRSRDEVREAAPVAALRCGWLHPPPLTPRRGTGGPTRCCHVEVQVAAPAAMSRCESPRPPPPCPVEMREAVPLSPSRLHGRKAELASRHG
jgi:hypothetical protein